MSNKSAAPRKPVSIPGKTDLKARQAELEAMRKRNQTILLTIVGLVALVAVVGIIIISSRAPEAPVDTAELAKKLDGITFGKTTVGAEYPLEFPTMGDPNAPVKMEEVSSFACPACASYHDSVVENLYDKVRAGQLYFVYLPTTRTGELSGNGKFLSTAAGYCAMQQDKFWQMHEILFDWKNRYALEAADPRRINEGAQKLGLDMGKFNACLDAKATRDYIDASDKYVSEVRKMASTPSVFLFVRGKQLEPQDNNSNTPMSMNGLDVGTLRGIIESANAAPLQPTGAATQAATAAVTTAATTAATVAPTTAATP